MNIRSKLLSVILPVLAGSLVLVGVTAYTMAARAVTRVAAEFLDFKAFELKKYAESQWSLLLQNGLAGRPEMVDAAKAGVASFAQTIARRTTESIFAVEADGALGFQSSPRWEPAPGDQEKLKALTEGDLSKDLQTLNLGGTERMAVGFVFEPFQWRVFVTEDRRTFLADVESITWATIIILAAAVLFSTMLLLFFISKVTGPIVRVAKAMEEVINSGDMTTSVNVEYNDEVGKMSHTFNLMIKELERAYAQIKRYALEAVLAQRKERKIRQIFQKYVPQDVIDKLFQNPEGMLVGENRVLSVLFSDIRSFTSISESMAPDELVLSLNRYFGSMVEIIMERGGIVDKYIGDAIMAFYGAPIAHDNDAQQSLESALDMIDALTVFNADQVKKGAPEFKIGIGINYGLVTVGNIGSERKMDYTVIGDMVNLASRLEGQTKPYHEALIFSEFLQEALDPSTPVRLVDSIAVKGKKKGVKIYTSARGLTAEQLSAWKKHNQAMELYYARRFRDAALLFKEVYHQIGAGDPHSKEMFERCQANEHAVLPDDWNGVEVKTEK